jgi:hypothetical protein
MTDAPWRTPARTRNTGVDLGHHLAHEYVMFCVLIRTASQAELRLRARASAPVFSAGIWHGRDSPPCVRKVAEGRREVWRGMDTQPLVLAFAFRRPQRRTEHAFSTRSTPPPSIAAIKHGRRRRARVHHQLCPHAQCTASRLPGRLSPATGELAQARSDITGEPSLNLRVSIGTHPIPDRAPPRPETRPRRGLVLLQYVTSDTFLDIPV